MAQAVRVSVAAAEAELAADALWQAGAAAIEVRPGELVAAPAAGPMDGDHGPGGTPGGRVGDPDSDDTARGDPEGGHSAGIARLLAAVADRWPAVVEPVDLDGALDAWRDHARALAVGGRLLVRPPWVPSPAGTHGRREVVIDPGRAFGHGAHPSTRLVLEVLDRQVRGGERVLDVGCGSGVLAIAALVLGAGEATAVDVDPAARAATIANASRNGVAARLSVLPGLSGRRDYDLIVANMLLPDLVSVAPDIAAALAPGGTVVVSGVLVDQRAEASAAYAGAGLTGIASSTTDDWLALTLQVP